jgi:propanol-preferring alcohol dehydrogenase
LLLLRLALHINMADTKTYDVPKTCKAGVVVNEGPDFKLEIEDVPVPEPGKRTTS